MSQSPTETPDANWIADEGSEYRQRWAKLDALVEQGNSWSGHERNCFFLNLGNGRFSNLSGASGFDFAGDGRGMALSDWDGDGDLDVWLTNRTGPRLQYLENLAAGGNRGLILRLVGNGETCNRDAIGARIDLVMADSGGKETLVRTVRAGDGFLSQASKQLHIGLGAGATIESLVVHWPGGGTESITGLEADGEYTIMQGSGIAKRVDLPGPATLPAPAPPAASDNGRLVLDSRPSLPVLSFPSLDGKSARKISEFRGKPVLLNLWAPWCAPCLAELREIAEHAEALRATGLSIIALSVDEPEKAPAVLARTGYPFHAGRADERLVELLHLLYHHVYAKPYDLPVPTSFLIDAEGRLAAVYRGAPGIETLLEDSKALSSQGELRSDLPMGTWAVKPGPPALGDLAWDLFYQNFPREGAAFVLEHKQKFGPGAGYTRMIGKTATELLKSGQHAKAGALFEEALALEPDDLMSRNNLAWIQATSPDAGARDGAAAVRHAEHAARLTQQQNPAVLETLAAAYAEAGRFPDALATVSRALELARAGGNARLVESLTRARSQYSSSRPLRMRASD